MRPAYRHGPPTRRNGRPSRAFRIDRLHEDPLERPDPPAELVLRDHEDLEIRRAPLQKLAAQLLETHLDRLLVSHVQGVNPLAGNHSRRGRAVKEKGWPPAMYPDKPGGRWGGMLVVRPKTWGGMKVQDLVCRPGPRRPGRGARASPHGEAKMRTD